MSALINFAALERDFFPTNPATRSRDLSERQFSPPAERCLQGQVLEQGGRSVVWRNVVPKSVAPHRREFQPEPLDHTIPLSFSCRDRDIYLSYYDPNIHQKIESSFLNLYTLIPTRAGIQRSGTIPPPRCSRFRFRTTFKEYVTRQYDVGKSHDGGMARPEDAAVFPLDPHHKQTWPEGPR
jgi:hypothetical protein